MVGAVMCVQYSEEVRESNFQLLPPLPLPHRPNLLLALGLGPTCRMMQWPM